MQTVGIKPGSRTVARGLAGLLALVALVVGVPLILSGTVGWPLPTSIPPWSEISRQLSDSGSIDDRVWLKVLACVGWLTWARVTLAIAVAVVAETRGRRWQPSPGWQAAIAQLVVAVAVLASTFAQRPAPAVAVPPLPQPVALNPEPVDLPASPQSVPELPTSDRRPAVESGTSPTWQVARGDTLWAIAETALGDPFRWREIFDLNHGRPQSDGSILTDPKRLGVGWVLQLPSTARVPSPSFASQAESEGVVVKPGDSLWEIADERLASSGSTADVVAAVQALAEANRGVLQPDCSSLQDPSAIRPGWHLTLPAPDVATPNDVSESVPVSPAVEPAATVSSLPSVPDTPPTSPTTRTTPPNSPVTQPVAARTATIDVDKEQPSGTVKVVSAAGGIGAALALGVSASVRRRRRRRLVEGVATPPTPPHLEELHRNLVARGAEEPIAQLAGALRHLARQAAAKGLSCRPRIVQQHGSHIEVFLGEPVDAIDGWQSEAEGLVWSLGEGVEDHDSIDETVGSVAPCLVTLGAADEGGQLYIDLEAEGVIALVGDVDVARGVARAIALELMHSLMADALQLVLVGHDLGLAAGANDERIRVVDRWADVSGDVAAWTSQAGQALAVNEWPNSFVARVQAPTHAALVPLVVISTEPVDLDAYGANGASAIVIVGHEPSVATVIDCTADRLDVADLGLVCRPQSVDVETADAVADLCDRSSESLPEPVAAPVAARPAVPAEASPSEPYEDPEYDILVRVLGDITVEGGSKPLTPKQTAVVTYIALHGTVSADRLEDAVWSAPTRGSRRKRLANTISECRATIGAVHLPVAADGRYRAGARIMTDIGLFERRLTAAEGRRPKEQTEILRGALDLLRGPVFSYRSGDRASYTWVDVENWFSIWELKIAAVGQRLVELYVRLGLAAEAVTASEQVIRVVPMHAGVTEALMRAHAANGDRLAVRRVYEAHVAALAQLEIDDAADTTVLVYQELRSNRAQ